MMSVNHIANVIGTFISYLNVSLIYSLIAKAKFKIRWWLLGIILIMAIFNTYVIVLLPIGFKTIYNLLCLIIINKLAYKDNFGNNIYNVIVIWVVGIIMDMFFMALFSVALEKVLKLMPNIGLAVISLLLQAILYLFFKIKIVVRFVNKLKTKIDMINNIVLLFGLSISLIVLFSVLAFTNLKETNSILMIILISLIAITIVLFFIKILYDKKMYYQAINNLINNNRYYLELNNSNRVFKHNIIHQLNSVKSVSNAKTISLIDDIIKSNKITDTLPEGIESLPNGINGIICSYIYKDKRKQLDIAINNYINSDLFDVLTPRKYNKLCEVLGILLDNAVNASKNSKEKIIQIVTLEDSTSIQIKIINTFSTSLEVDKLGKLNYTTKKTGHGIGLSSIFKQRSVVVKTRIVNSLFESVILVKKKKTINE